MNALRRTASGLFLLLLLAPVPLVAQPITESPDAYAAERTLIRSTLQTIVSVVQEAAFENEHTGFGDRLGALTDQLTRAATLMDPSATPVTASADDLDELARLLADIAADLDDVREDLREDGERDLADRLAPIQRDLRRAAREADRLADATPERRRTDDRWLRPDRYDDDDDDDHRHRHDDDDDDDHRRHRHDDDDDDGHWDDDDDDGWNDDDDDDGDWRPRSHRRYDYDTWRGNGDPIVGAFSGSWPYGRQTALYRPVPALRYNRVEGFVLGAGLGPEDWGNGRLRPYGQLAYAFALDEWRYEAGGEIRLAGDRYDGYGLKAGGSYYHNTYTRDDWKTTWFENSLAAFFFEDDFFDFHDIEGWQLYAAVGATPYVQLSGGYRQDDYVSLAKQTGWSVFEGNGFRFNPPIDDGRMQSVVLALDGGHVRDLDSLPRGAAVRLETEIGEGTGGDFDFNRFVGDARVYLPVSDFSSLGFRLRAGIAEGDFVPLQKQFTLGGIGTVRGYPQNALLGTRLLLGNAEYVASNFGIWDDVLDDVALIGFFDAGWVNVFGTDDFRADDVLTTAGFGLGFDDRTFRIEVAFPLRDFGGDRDPSLWLRITPSF